MTGRQMRETERNIRSEDILRTNAADFSDITAAARMIADLTAQVAKVQQEYRKQIESGGDARQDYDLVRDNYDALLAEMRDVRNTAVSIGRTITGFEEMFRLPPGRGRRALIAAARVFVDNARQHETEFDNYGMNADFFANLRSIADALENALDEAAASTGERVGATDTLEIDVDAASDIVEAINPIVQRVYRDNPSKLAAWNFARRVERHTPVPRTPPPPTG